MPDENLPARAHLCPKSTKKRAFPQPVTKRHQMRPPIRPENGTKRGLFDASRTETRGNVRLVSCARKTPLHVCDAPVIRWHRGTPTTNRGRAVGVLNWQAPPGSTYEGERRNANRFRFGKGSGMPNRCRGGHLRANRQPKTFPLACEGDGLQSNGGKCVSGERTRNPPPRFPQSFPRACVTQACRPHSLRW